jgi:hypothetical protein
MVNGRPTVVAPPTARDISHAQQEVAKAFQYKGTTALAHRRLNPNDAGVKAVCAMLSKADFIPGARIQRFSGLDRRFTVVGWSLTVDQMEVRANDTLVRVRAAPLLKAQGEGTIGVMTFYGENYRIAGGKLEFLGSDPIPADLRVMTSGQ